MKQRRNKIVLAGLLAMTMANADEVTPSLHLSETNLNIATNICEGFQGTIEDLEFDYITEGITKTSNISDMCKTENLLINFAFEDESTQSLATLAQASLNSDVKDLQPALFIVSTKEKGLQRSEAIMIEGAKEYNVAYVVIHTGNDNYVDLALEAAESIMATPKTPEDLLAIATDELQKANVDVIRIYDRFQKGLTSMSEYNAVLSYAELKQVEYDVALNSYNAPLAQSDSDDTSVVANSYVLTEASTAGEFVSPQQRVHNKAVETHENLHVAYFGYKYREDYVLLKDIDAKIDKAHKDMEAKQRQYTAAAYGTQAKADFARERNILWRYRDNLKAQKFEAVARFNKGKNAARAANNAIEVVNKAVTKAENDYARAWFNHEMPFGDKEATKAILDSAVIALFVARTDRDEAYAKQAEMSGMLDALKVARVALVETHPAYIEYKRQKSIADNLQLIVDYSRNLNWAWQGCSYLNACYRISAFSKINWSITGSLEQAQQAIHKFNRQEQKLFIVRETWDIESAKLLKDLPPLS